MKRLSALFSIFLALVLIVSGCTQGTPDNASSVNGGDSQNAQTSSPAEGAETDSNINPANVFPIAKEQVALKIAIAEPDNVDTNYDTNFFTTQLEELTNIDIQWELINSSAFIENVNVMFASGSLPDILNSGVAAATRLDKARESQLATQGMIIPLDDLIAEYAPNITTAMAAHEGMQEYVRQPDGKQYSLSGVDDSYHILWSAKYWINDTWLSNLNLAYPTTPDELYDVLVAFRDNDPNQNGIKDEIPLSSCKEGAMVMLDAFLMNAFTYSPGPNRLYLRDGQVAFTPTQDGFAEGLKYMNKLYTEDLIYVDSFSQDRAAQVALNENGDVPVLGGWPAQHLSYGTDVSDNSDKWKQYKALAPLKGPNPESPIASYDPYIIYNPGHIVITKDCAEPEAAVRLCDYLYTTEGVMGAFIGREGMEWEAAPAGSTGLKGDTATWVTIPHDSKDPNYQNISWGQLFPMNRPMELYATEAYPSDPYDPTIMPGTAHTIIRWGESEKYEAVSQKHENALPGISFADDVAAEAVQLKTTIDQYVNEMVAAFITGNQSIDDNFDAFLTELDKMGLPRYLELVQSAYDASYSK
jgi:putative aldouronate transport system substrate-binding protein